jgi:Cu-Zn family superoxide dismutase
MLARILTGTLAVVASTFCASLSRAASNDEATAELRDRDGLSVGTVRLEETPHGTLLHVELQGLPEGGHALHVHTVGKCEPPFESAGGHFNPSGNVHGFLAENGPHVGDLPNIHVPGSGTLEFEIFSPSLKLDDALFDSDGAAIVIHAGTDDYTTDPAGDAGDRIACGAIER